MRQIDDMNLEFAVPTIMNGLSALEIKLMNMHPAQSQLFPDMDCQYNSEFKRLLHGTSLAYVERILCARRLVRGNRGKHGYYGVYASEKESTALRYSTPWRNLSMVFSLNAYMSKSVGNGNFVLKEYWIELTSLTLVWNTHKVNPKQYCSDLISKSHVIQSPVVAVPTCPCFRLWARLDADFWDQWQGTPEVAESEHSLVLKERK